MAIETQTSGYFNNLVSSISADEAPLVLVEIDHATLVTPFRLCNDNQDLISNGDLYYGVSFALNLPSQPAEGLMGTSITIANPGDRTIPDFLEEVKGQGVTARIQVVLRSAPNDVEYEVTLDASQFSINKDVITARLSAPNYYTVGWASILYGAKYSPAIL